MTELIPLRPQHAVLFGATAVAAIVAITAGLLGASAPAHAQAGVATQVSFTLQVLERRSGLQFNANYGFVRVRYYRTQVLVNGKPLKLPKAGGGSETEFKDAFLLRDAPLPAVLVNHEGWQLVTDQAGQPKVRALTTGPAEGLCWAEGPPQERRISGAYVRLEPPATLELQGRRLLLLDAGTVLDVATLATHPTAASCSG